MRRSACQQVLRSSRRPLFHPRRATFFSQHRSSSPHQTWNRRHRLESSYTTYTLAAVVICGSAFLLDYTFRDRSTSAPRAIATSAPTTSHDPFFTDMPIPPGSRGNLTGEQELKLREFWIVVLKTFGVEDPNHLNGIATPQEHETASVSEADPKKKKRKSIFGRKHDDVTKNTDTSDDKYGQVKEFQQIVSTQTPESLRVAFWSMVKADHPDALLLRYLRARKWDVDKALVMLISTISWRQTEMKVDNDVVLHGEGGALHDSKSSDANAKKEGNDFMAQLRLGKSFLHGTDKEGRPLCVVRVRLHHGGDQSERSLERYTVYVIETTRLLLRPPVEMGTIIFDMTHFTMANMDYTPVKFMIKVFEANYPESLGMVLVHKSPWIFQGIWKIIKGWLDPVVAAKVHFTSDVKDLEEFIPRSQIIKELGGDEHWEYTYVEPQEGEDELLKDTATRDKLNAERASEVQQYQSKTFEWINSPNSAEVKQQRDDIAVKLHDNYWQLDPYVRAKTLYDRVGMIEKSGKINFYPSHEKAKREVEGTTKTGQGAMAGVPPKETGADDVD